MKLHTAVIDAASSGTRLFHYRAKPGPLATAGMRYAEGLHGRRVIDRLHDTSR